MGITADVYGVRPRVEKLHPTDENQSGGKRDRPELNRALDRLRKGDVFIVCKLDRLSRSLDDLLQLFLKFSGFLLQMLGAFAEFERQMIRERTKLGLARARAEGRIGGKRAALSLKQQQQALAMIDSGQSQSEVAELFGVHRATICRLVAERRVLAA